MRKQNREIKDKTIIEEILRSVKIIHVAMVDDGKPYVLPLNYGYSDNTIYIHCALEGRKIDILTKNPQVCFEVTETANIIDHERACGWSTAYRSVIGEANVKIVDDYDEKIKSLDILMKHHGSHQNTYERKNVDLMYILKLDILEMTGKQSGNWNTLLNSEKYTMESERLLFKEITWNDIGKIHQLRCIPEVDKYNTLGIPKSIEETKNIYKSYIEDRLKTNRSKICWLVFTKDTNEFIGEAGFSFSLDRFLLGEIYYNLNPKYWGVGYGTEIAKRQIKFGFETLGLHKVEAGVDCENEKSVKVLEKAGMVREGRRYKILPIRGEWRDNYHYAIVEDKIF